MPSYNYEGSILETYSGVVEASSEEEAREILRTDMDWDGWDEQFTEIDWIAEVED